MTTKAALTEREHINEPELCKGRSGGDHYFSVDLSQVFSMFLNDLFAISDSESNVRLVPAKRRER